MDDPRLAEILYCAFVEIVIALDEVQQRSAMDTAECLDFGDWQSVVRT
jgi:hypothetical protein